LRLAVVSKCCDKNSRRKRRRNRWGSKPTQPKARLLIEEPLPENDTALGEGGKLETLGTESEDEHPENEVGRI